MMRRLLLPVVIAMVPGCAVPTIVQTVHENSPPQSLGRPAWVSGIAEAGAWLGGGVGTLLSVVALPVTWPVAELSGEAIGADRDEVIWGPTAIGAGAGQFLFGAPFDFADWAFRRAWQEERPTADDYVLVAQQPPVGPVLTLEPLPDGQMRGPAPLPEDVSDGTTGGGSPPESDATPTPGSGEGRDR